MDPAGIGALLGLGLLFGCFLLVRICEIYDKRKKKMYAALLQQQTTTDTHIGLYIRKPAHWKVQNLGLPKAVLLSSLSK